MESYEVEEVWKDIPEYEGLYQVSNLGRIKSLSRKVEYKSWPYFRMTKDVIMKQSKGDTGYFQITIKKNEPKTFKVHQLIAIAFLNHKRNGNNMVVDHVDGNKENNNLSNLNIIHNRQNISKGMRKNGLIGSYERNGRYRSMIRVNNKLVHLGTYDTAEEASAIYNDYFKKITQ